MEPASSNLTVLLKAWCEGDDTALARLAPLVESELRGLASFYLSREGPGHTLQPTALVNEAYIRLIEWKNASFENRAHFFSVAAKIMRRILVSQAVGRSAQKRGGSTVLVSLAETDAAAEEPGVDVVALDATLTKLAAFDERKSQIVELRFFGGLSAEESAEVMGMTVRNLRREWTLARAWLYRELSGGRAGK